MKRSKFEKIQELVAEYAHNGHIRWTDFDELVARCATQKMLYTLQKVKADNSVIFAAKTYDVDAAFTLMFAKDYTVIGIEHDPNEQKAYFTEA